MKKYLFFILLFSCEKPQPTTAPACWTCTEVATGYAPKITEQTVCDVLEAAKLNGQRWVTYTDINGTPAATVHKITCKQ